MSQETPDERSADEVQRGRIEAVGGATIQPLNATKPAPGYWLLRGVRLATNQVRYSLISVASREPRDTLIRPWARYYYSGFVGSGGYSLASTNIWVPVPGAYDPALVKMTKKLPQ